MLSCANGPLGFAWSPALFCMLRWFALARTPRSLGVARKRAIKLSKLGFREQGTPPRGHARTKIAILTQATYQHSHRHHMEVSYPVPLCSLGILASPSTNVVLWPQTHFQVCLTILT